jgi:hypothetical protein
MGKKNLNKCRGLQNKWHFVACTAITDLAIKGGGGGGGNSVGELIAGHVYHRHVRYRLSCDGELNERFFYWAYKITGKKDENKLCITKKKWSVYT